MIENARKSGLIDLIGAIYMENRSGPRTEPCGTPYSRGRGSEEKSQNLTEDDLFRM